MPMLGVLTNLLKPEYREQGYALTEDDHFLYLHYDGKVVGVFNAHQVTMEDVEAHIVGKQ